MKPVKLVSVLSRSAQGARTMLVVAVGLLALHFFVPAAASDGSGAVNALSSGLDGRPENTTCVAPQRPPQTSVVILEQVVRMARWPLAIVHAPNDLSTWYAVFSDGRINRYRRTDGAFSFANVFAETGDRSTNLWEGKLAVEMGLLGIAFHPKFASNGFVFLYYSAVGTGGTAVESRLSRFISRDGGVTLDMSSEEVLIRTARTTQWHWGGTLMFGPDGLLYAGFGDGAKSVQSQNLDSLLGKMIRINVDGPTGYAIPESNPFAAVPNARGEIYAYGFRNPWKWSFDKATGDLWLGDVGSNSWEEVDLVKKGGNYGWPIREGAHCNLGGECSVAGLIDPVVEYSHNGGGAAVIGGYVYRGTRIPSLQGIYVYADRYRGIFALRTDASGKPSPELLLEAGGPGISTFAQEEDGEILVATGTSVLRLSPQSGTVPTSNFPQTLSTTGCMDASNPALPAAGLIPYDVNSPLWSDGATKERWFAMPEGTSIVRQSDGDWDLPVGSVTVKHFRIKDRLVETRLMVRHDDGNWAGYSYEWNDAQTDAHLLPAGKVKTVEGQQWTYPSRSQCLACHTEAAGHTLGLETAQLNRDLLYPSTQRTANQLMTLDAIGMFSQPLNVSPSALDKLTEPSDTSQPLELRARSYLHANCSICHRPGGPGQGPEDFRYSLPGLSIGAINVIPTQSTFGITDARLIYPGKPEKSTLSYRLKTLELGRMPPLATAVVDVQGSALVDQWIRSGLGMGVTDRENDGFADNVDNCKNTPNPNQLDTDGDGFGNMCDADFDNNGFVNALDLAHFRQAFGSQVGDARFNPNVDLNGDGRINALDLGLFRTRFGKPVGDL